MKHLQKKLLLVLITCFAFSCSDNDGNEVQETTPANPTTAEEVIETYADIVYASYQDSYDAAVVLQSSISEFTANPTSEGLETVKQAWIEAREFYGQTEVYRGSNGPIDSESDESWAINNEGQINAWPLDEAFIDYVTGTDTDNSIIATTEAALITMDLLASKNEYDNNEANVSTGWHAIEFLLWGQDTTDPIEKKAGERPYTDFTTLSNADRRIKYLNEVTQLLVNDLNDLTTTWAEGGTYRDVFLALDENTALTNIVRGPHFLAGEELSAERLLASVDEGQELEHSCFSDNTHRDVYTNGQGIFNVLYGTYGDIEGASIFDLVQEADADQAAALKTASDIAWASLEKINDKAELSNIPYDLMIEQENSTENPGIIIYGYEDLRDLSDVISESVNKLDIALD